MRLYDIIAAQIDIFILKIFLTFIQCKRIYFNIGSYTSVKSAFIFEEFTMYPGCCTAAHNQHDVIPAIAPSVPKTFKSRKET